MLFGYLRWGHVTSASAWPRLPRLPRLAAGGEWGGGRTSAPRQQGPKPSAFLFGRINEQALLESVSCVTLSDRTPCGFSASASCSQRRSWRWPAPGKSRRCVRRGCVPIVCVPVPEFVECAVEYLISRCIRQIIPKVAGKRVPVVPREVFTSLAGVSVRVC